MALVEPRESISPPETPVDQQHCDNCYYSRVKKGIVECHYDPPQASADRAVYGWVPVALEDWCGKWSTNR